MRDAAYRSVSESDEVNGRSTSPPLYHTRSQLVCSPGGGAGAHVVAGELFARPGGAGGAHAAVVGGGGGGGRALHAFRWRPAAEWWRRRDANRRSSRRASGRGQRERERMRTERQAEVANVWRQIAELGDAAEADA